MKIVSSLICLMLLACGGRVGASALTPAGQPVELALPGHCAIVIPEPATVQERFGAELLKKYLKPLFGIDAEIVADTDANRAAVEAASPYISIGQTRFAPKDGTFADQGYELRLNDGNLYIQGGHRGVIYGVLALLEEDWGLRHYNQYEEVILPEKAILQVTPRAFTPVFEMREPLYQDAWGAPKAGEWAGFNRMQPVSYFSKTPAEYGGAFCNPQYFIHTYADLIPTEKYFDTHPEFFPMRGGKRHRSTRTDGQLCYTNPELPKVIAEQLRAAIAEAPESRVYSVSANDNVFDNCECPECTALISSEGMGAAQMLLANRVADELTATLPDIRITALAYVASQVPPKTVFPSVNTVPFYAPIRERAGALRLLPWTEVPKIVDELTAWSKVSDKIYIWDYVDNGICNDLPTPDPNFDPMTATIDYWGQSGVNGAFLEAAECSRGSLGELKSWFFTKKLWNPAWNTDDLIEDFIAGYYGKAAPAMRRYVALQRDAWKRWHDSYTEGVSLRFSPEEIQTMRDILKEAAVAAGDDQVLADKIRREQLSVLLLVLKGFPERSNPKPYADALAEAEGLIATLKLEKFGVKTMSKDLVASWHKKLDEATNGSPLPLYCQESGVLTTPQVWYGEERPDPAAATGKGFRQYGVGSDWGMQWSFEDLLNRFPNQQVLVARVRAKPELKHPHGANDPFFQLSLWKSGVAATQGVTVPFGEKPGSDYNWYYLFRVYLYSPSGEGYFYSCPGTGLQKDEAVWFDFIEFIPIEQFKDKAFAESLPLITL